MGVLVEMPTRPVVVMMVVMMVVMIYFAIFDTDQVVCHNKNSVLQSQTIHRGTVNGLD